MNKDNVDASLQKLHDGTVGRTQRRLRGRRSSPIATWCRRCSRRRRAGSRRWPSRSVHHDLDTAPGVGRRRPTPELPPGMAARTDTVLVVATSVSRERRRPSRRPCAGICASTSPTSTASCSSRGWSPCGAMRNVWRVLAFDIVGPLAAIAALLMIGVFLGWPLWWVAVCVDAVPADRAGRAGQLLSVAPRPGHRRHRRRRTRAAAGVGRVDDGRRWPPRCSSATRAGPFRTASCDNDTDEVVRLATAVSEATATFSPQDPRSSIDRAAAMMAPEQADAFRANFGKSTRRPCPQEHLGAGADDLGRAGGAGSGRGQRGSGDAGHPERTGAAAQPRRAGACG